MKMPITTDEKQKIRLLKKCLPHGSMKKIAKQLGMSEISITKILDGQWSNQKVIDASVELLKNHVEEAEGVIQYFKEKKEAI